MSAVELLWLLVAAQMLMVGLAWTATIPISRSFRGAVVGLVAFNLVLGVSLLLIGLRDELPYLIGHTVSNLLALWSMVAIIQAADQMLKIRISQREIWVVMTLAGVGILVFGLDSSTANWRALVLFVAIAWMLARTGVKVWRVQAEPHLRMPVKSIALISLVLAVLLFVRAVAGVAGQVSIEFSAADGLTQALPFVVLGGVSLVNLGFAYLAISSVFTRLRQQARSDELTGLLNRRALTEEIGRAWAHFAKTHETFALICLDIDKLRDFNATAGRAAGDALVKAIADAVGGLLGPGDAMGRAGGGKFVCVMAKTGMDEARGLAEHMRAKVADLQDLISDQRVKPSASFGVAISAASDAGEEAVLVRANAHLAAAKAAGRNRVIWEIVDEQVTVQSAPA